MEILKVDPYNTKQKYERWKSKNSKRIKGISRENSKLILQYLSDMELGINIHPSSKRGSRSYLRLLAMKSNLTFISKYLKDFKKLKQKDLFKFFDKLKSGKIKKRNGELFKCPREIIKNFKIFWGWMIRSKNTKRNITQFLSTNDERKPSWVYLTENEMIFIIKNFPRHISPILYLLYDSGMRVTEANSIRVCDFSDNFTKLNIPDEVSKTFGRKINLTFSSDIIKSFIHRNRLKETDRIFICSPSNFNKYLKLTANKIYGEKTSPAREQYKNLSLYDLRHNSACYWANRYSTTRGLMYRFGWNKEAQAFYYHEFLGFTDEIKPLQQTPSVNLQNQIITLIKTLKIIQSQNIKNLPF